MRSMRGSLFLALVLALVSRAPAGAGDSPIPGKIVIVRDGTLFKFVARPVGTFTIPPGDPAVAGADLTVRDTGCIGGSLSDSLSAGVWQGLGNPPGSGGYRYENALAPSGGAVKLIIFRPKVIKILARDDGALHPPVGSDLRVDLFIGLDRFCASFGGTEVKNVPALFKAKDAPAPLGSCPTDAPPCGPGAVAIPGTAAACLDATTCP